MGGGNNYKKKLNAQMVMDFEADKRKRVEEQGRRKMSEKLTSHANARGCANSKGVWPFFFCVHLLIFFRLLSYVIKH